MSAPKRAAKTTSSRSTPTKKNAAKPTASRKQEAAKPANQKATGRATKPAKPAAPAKSKKAAATKAPAKSSAKPAAKAAAKAAPKSKVSSTAQKVAKKVAKIISKIVAKKKTVAKNSSAAAPVKAKTKAAAKPKKKAATKPKVTAKPVPAATKPKPGVVAKTKTTTATPRRPKSFAPRDVERGFGFPSDTPELPEAYGEDRLVLMTKDPEYLFAYWEITPEKTAEGEKVKHRGEEYREALRLNWASRDIFERNFSIMPVSLAARKGYLRVPFSGLAYQVEIGWLGESGHFISLLTSNPSDAPESWTATRRRLKNAAKSGGILERTLSLGRPQGSSDLASQTAAAAPKPYDWNFPGPGTQTSSFGKAKKAGRRAAR